jgi:hypothetical protein
VRKKEMSVEFGGKKKGKKNTDLEDRVREHVDDLTSLPDVVKHLTVEADHVGVSRNDSSVGDGEGLG